MKPIKYDDGVYDGLNVHAWFCPRCDQRITGWWSDEKMSKKVLERFNECPKCGQKLRNNDE